MNRRAARREVLYWAPNGSPAHLPQPDRGRLPVVLLSGFCIATAANGFSLLTGLPFLVNVLVVIVFYWIQMSFVRYQPLEQRNGVSGSNGTLGYFILGIIFTSVMAFGLYGVGAKSSFIDFIRATLEKGAYAVACWLIAGFIVVIIFLLVQEENHDFELWE
jgi:hypothetical protein